MENEKIWTKAKNLVEDITNNIKTKNVQWKKVIVGFSLIVGLGTASFFYYQSGFSHEVKLNGKNVGYIKDEASIGLALDIIEKNVSDTYGEVAYFQKAISSERVRGHNKELVNIEKLAENMTPNIQVQKPATIVSIDGEEVLIVESKEVIDSLLEDSKKVFENDKEDKDIEVVDLYIKQEIETVDINLPVESILSKEDAALVLGLDYNEEEEYLLAREALVGRVSRSLSSRLDRAKEIEAENAELAVASEVVEEEEVVRPRILDIVRVENHKSTESIDFKEEEKNDSTMYKGEKKVKQEGEKGKKEIITEVVYTNGKVTSKDVIKETVVEEAKNKITLIGTKERPRPVASRPAASRPASSSSKKTQASRGSAKTAPKYNGQIGSAVVATARHYLGVPYVYGGSSPSGFDCSGLTSYVYRQYGISLPRSSGGQASVGAYVSRAQLQPGDIVTFPGHVGLYIGGGNMIHAPRPGKVVEITSIDSSYYKPRFKGGRRVY